MKAMILAAGKGTRVRPMTHHVPKPMLPLLGKPVMESIVEHLARHDFDEIMINTSHLSDQIHNYFRQGESCGVHIGYSFEGRLVHGQVHGEALGSAGGMRRIQDNCGFFDDTFVVLCGDALIDVDLTAAVKFHRQRGALATIVLKEVPVQEVSNYGVVAVDPDGRIETFQEKPPVEEAVSNLVNTGIYLFDPRIFDYIPAGEEYDIGSELFPAIVAAGEPFYGVSLPFQWVDIGNVRGYWEATAAVLNGEVENFSLPGKEIRPGVHVGIGVAMNADKVHIEGPVVIGAGCRIADGVTITGPCEIGANCDIGANATIARCSLDAFVKVHEGCELQDRIIFRGDCMTTQGDLLDPADLQGQVDDCRRDVAAEQANDDLYQAAGESA